MGSFHSKLLKVSLKGHFVLSQDGHSGYSLKLLDYINSYLRTQWLSLTVYSLGFSVTKPYWACIKLNTMFPCTPSWGDEGPLYLWILETGPSITLSPWLQGRSQWINTPPPCCHKRFSLYPKPAQNTEGIRKKSLRNSQSCRTSKWQICKLQQSVSPVKYGVQFFVSQLVTTACVWDIKQFWNSW